MSFGPRRLLAALLLCYSVSPCFAQTKSKGLPTLTPEQMQQLQKQGINPKSLSGVTINAVQQSPGGQPTQSKPAKNAKNATDKGSKDTKKANGKKPLVPPVTITRPTEFDGNPDPKELELRPDEAGKLKFNFNGQPWPGVLEWLAEVSECSLQWKELPGDFLTLTTRRSYSVDEARDIINQQLLSRGYTMLKDRELLYVVPLAKINKAMIPRVKPEDLAKRQPNEFVRVSFKLEWMVAGDAVTELTPMLSEHGKLYQLASTNRIEAFDTVSNLTAIYELLQEEQSQQVEEGLVRQFVIKHRRAEEVMRLVQRLMGINPDNPAQPMSSAQIKQLQKVIQAAQKAGKGQVSRQPVPTVLVLNRPENSILVTAEPDKMKQIEQAIQQLDVAKKNGAMIGNMSRMKIYKLNTYDPEPLVKLLEELGELDPQTQLKVDKQNRSIMAYASLADHVLIEQLIERVDGASRTFSVLQLKQRDAEQVAGTIKKMMGVEEDNSNNYDYYYYRYRSGNKESDKFMIEADVEKNRLLVRANSTELNEIKNLLRKMGEDPDRIVATPDTDNRVRIFDLPAKDAAEAIERLRKLWPLENKLEIDVPTPQKTLPAETTTTAKKTTAVEPPKERFQRTKAAFQEQDDPITKFFKGQTTQVPGPPNLQFPQERPPVRISVRDGRIIVTSDDPVALAEVSRLLEQLLPKQIEKAEDYKVYTLQFVSPFWMAGTLEDFFDIDTDSGFFWSPPKKDNATLGKKKEMRFVTDSYTKTLIVLNATPEQHVSIAELIKIMDKPEQSEERLIRVTKIFPIKHSQATAIQNVIKEVYRDLLSGNDKDLQQPPQDGGGGNGKRKGGSGGGAPTQFFGGLSSATYLTDDEDEKVKFRGQLSVSADPISNTLTVSGTASLVKDIGDKIEILDQAARPASNMRVVPVSKNINVAALQKRLEKLLGPKQQPQQQKKGQKNGQNPQVPSQGQPNNR